MKAASNTGISVRADYRQFLADDYLIIAITSILIGAMPVLVRGHDRYLSLAVMLMTVFMLSVLIIRYATLVCIRWSLDGEMLCRTSGVLSHKIDYIELYRIVDYKESRTLMQRMLGIKTVTIYSTDKSDAVSDIPGVPVDMDIVGMLREKVEESKKQRNIYEITNR